MNGSRGEGCEEGEPVDGVRWSSAMSESRGAGRDGDDPSELKFDLILPTGPRIGGGELSLEDAVGSRCWDTPANEGVKRSAGADGSTTDARRVAGPGAGDESGGGADMRCPRPPTPRAGA